MNVAELQRKIGAKDDGRFGPMSRSAFVATFTNRAAPLLSDADFVAAAKRLGCTVAQIKAVRTVEAAGKGFDRDGRPKLLFERHRFHKLTGGAFSPTPFSMPARGGYDYPSWLKLMDAIATGEVDAAFQSASWGAFQVMGEYWDELGYPSPFALAWTCVQSEADQLELLLRYVEYFHLQDEIQALGPDAVSCRAFAAAYNGPAFKTNQYDVKLAAEMHA